MSSNTFTLTQEQLDALSTYVHAGDGSVESENFSLEPQDPAVTAEMQQQRLSDFFAEGPPFRQRAQSVAAARRSMEQRIQAFDLAFEGPVPPRRSTR